MQIGGLPGKTPKRPDGQANTPIRLGNFGDVLTSGLHGGYYEQTYRKNSFWVATQSVATTSVGLTTTYTGLCLSNPITSPVNLVLETCSVMQSVIQSAQPEAYAIAYGYNATTNVTHTASQAVQSSLIGDLGLGYALADTSATLPTAPLYGTFVTATTSATTNSQGGLIDLQGSIVLPPGGFACWVTPAQASVAGLWFSFSWEEVPV